MEKDFKKFWHKYQTNRGFHRRVKRGLRLLVCFLVTIILLLLARNLDHDLSIILVTLSFVTFYEFVDLIIRYGFDKLSQLQENLMKKS